MKKKLGFMFVCLMFLRSFFTPLHANNQNNSFSGLKGIKIQDLPEVVFMEKEVLPEEFAEYLYFPFLPGNNPNYQRDGANFGGGYLASGSVFSYVNTVGDRVELKATSPVEIDLNPGNKVVPYEFIRGFVKFSVNGKSDFKGYLTVADIDTGEWVKIKREDIYKIAIPENSELLVDVSEDGEWYTFYSVKGYGIDDPRAFFTFFFNDLSSALGIGFRGGYSVDFSNRVTRKKPSASFVVVNYVDTNANPLAEKVMLTGAIGSGFLLEEKAFDTYDLIEAPEDLEGLFVNDKPLEFTFVYKKQVGTVDVNYLAKINGEEKKLVSEQLFTGNVGTEFSIDAIEIPGYRLISDSSVLTGIFQKESKNLTFHYELKDPVSIDRIEKVSIFRNREISPIKVHVIGEIADIQVSHLPDGLGFDKDTMLITGKTSSPRGEETITITAKDPYGNLTHLTFVLEIKNKPTREDIPLDSKDLDSKDKEIIEIVEEKKDEDLPSFPLESQEILEDGLLKFTDDQIFNPTIENGKCYTRRPYLGIKDSVKIITSEEFKKAQSFFRTYEMTMFDSVDGFDPLRKLKREEAARFFSQFAINVLCRNPDLNLHTNYTDTQNADPTLKPYIELAYQLGVMKGSGMGDGEFRPKDLISKAEVNATLIRMILKSYLDESETAEKKRYSEYNKVAKELNIIKQEAGRETISRNDASLMLFRAYKNQVFDWRDVDYRTYVLDSRDQFVK